MIHQLTYTEGKHFWVTCSFVVLPISLDLTRKASPFQDGGYWVIGPNVEVDIDGEWVPVTNQRCSPNLPSEGGDDWHQNSETSFEQYVYTFDAVETTGIRLTGNAGGQDHFISVGEIRVTANFPSGCTPADTGPTGPATTGAGGPQCVETDTVGVPFDTLTDLGRVPEGGGNHDVRW